MKIYIGIPYDSLNLYEKMVTLYSSFVVHVIYV